MEQVAIVWLENENEPGEDGSESEGSKPASKASLIPVMY